MRPRKGSVLVLTALSLVMVCGFAALAVDYGTLVWHRNRLQHAADAAALAGATQLPNGVQAQYMAGVVAHHNAMLNPTYEWPSGLRQIKVTGSRQVPYGFARMLGFESGTVSATATAGRMPLRGIPDNVPLTMTAQDYAKYNLNAPIANDRGASFELQLVRNNKADFLAGTVMPLDLDEDSSSKAKAAFEEQLQDGNARTITLNSWVNTLAASLSATGDSLVSAMNWRIANNRRVMTLIVSDEIDANNNNPVAFVRRIVPVSIESVRKQGQGNNARYYLTLKILPSLHFTTDDPRVIVGDDSTLDSGVAVIQLLQ